MLKCKSCIFFSHPTKGKRYANQHKKQPTKQWKNWGALKWPKIGTNSSIKCLKCIYGFYIDDKDSNHSLRNSRSIFSRVSCFGRESPRAFETKAARSCCRSAASLLRASVEIMERESSATSNDFSIVVWMWPQKNARDIPPNTENLNLKMMGLGRWSSPCPGVHCYQVPAVNLLWWVSGVFKLRTTCVQGYISCHRSGHLASMRNFTAILRAIWRFTVKFTENGTVSSIKIVPNSPTCYTNRIRQW